MEVPVVKIKEGDPGSESSEKLIKSIVNMVRLEGVGGGRGLNLGLFACSNLPLEDLVCMGGIKGVVCH